MGQKEISVAVPADSAAQGQSMQFPHLDETLEILKTSDNRSILDRYKWETSLRDGMQEAGSKPAFVFPVMDMKHQSSQDHALRERLVKDIGLAAEEWGFFLVKNHTIPRDLIDKMMSYGHNFFSLPKEKKEEAVFNLTVHPGKNPYYQGYGGRFQHLQEKVPWLEHLGELEHPVSGVKNLASILWPESNESASFCEAVKTFSEAIRQLGIQIFELLAEHLKLERDFFSKHFAEDKAYQTNWRFNHYPPCPAPDFVLGLGPHTDPNALTIIVQGDVAGYQLLKNDFWFQVEPVPDTLLVNIGTALQVIFTSFLTSSFSSAILQKNMTNLVPTRLAVLS
ncbi:hypothetical protein AXG93_793s1020 [Marchantia polymorpha subsp. ruderalis]|uniref:Fe2OG dioxygenase domain-containing protein n=1 Tax=Marchantia polymorpha subsp. ruderalis TaxID=1480154 RepID=A0A176W2G9_MARPO|nr:hypothetical protein AXG93_793s1020 [Marchantia polymorpha subsp. ruderalis]